MIRMKQLDRGKKQVVIFILLMIFNVCKAIFHIDLYGGLKIISAISPCEHHFFCLLKSRSFLNSSWLNLSLRVLVTSLCVVVCLQILKHPLSLFVFSGCPWPSLNRAQSASTLRRQLTSGAKSALY